MITTKIATSAPSIIFQDEYFLVLNKPSGMTVNKADTTKDEETLQDWVERNFFQGTQIVSNTANISQTQSEYDPVKEFNDRGGIVHRLDKETSGVILVAKTPESFLALKKQFMEKTVKKTYVALAHGKVEPVEGEINVPVGRLEFNRKRFGVVAGGREAITKYKVLSIKYLVLGKQKEALSFVELYPETGRTHQIRVHLRHIGYPIFADFLYAGRKVARNDRKILNRFFLHAEKISFLHPKTGERVEFKADLPEELSTFLQKLTS